jgi:hypothetical protein
VRGFALDHVVVPKRDDTRVLYERYAAAGGATYVLRPDSHVAGRTRTPGRAAAIVAAALEQAGA